MIGNYAVAALRSIRKNKLTSAIAVLGFAIGIAAALFIFLYARYELSFDRFISGHERIYRMLVRAEDLQGEPFVTQTLSMDIKLPLLARTSAVEGLTQATPTNAVISCEGRKFYESGNVFVVDPSFLRVLDYPLAVGDPGAALERPFSIVLTQAAAEKYFGGESPMGRTLGVRGDYGVADYDCTVTGVLKDLPPNSSQSFDFLVSLPVERLKSDAARFYMETYGIEVDDRDISVQAMTFVKLKSAALYPRLRSGFDEVLKSSSLSRLAYRFKKLNLTSEKWDDIHLFSQVPLTGEKRGDFAMILLLAALALVVVAIACINVINLTTARAMTRMKEVGIRKTLGATRKELVAQYLVESVILCLLSLWIAAAMVELLLPSFNALFRTGLELRYLRDPAYLAAVLGSAVLIGLLSGLYPAFYLSSSGIVKVLKGHRTPSSKRFREAMVVLQFVISILLFVSSGVILREFESVKTTDLGFDPSGSVMARLNVPGVERKLPDIKRRLQAVPGVGGVTASSFAGWKYGSLARDFQFSVKGRRGACDIMVVEADFLRVQKIAIAAGRDFDPGLISEEGGQLVLNEAALKLFGAEPGASIRYDQLVGRVVGIAEDFDYLFPSGRIRPLVMTTSSPFMINTAFAPAPVHLNYLIIRISADDRSRVLADIERAWKEINPGFSFEYKLVDEEIASQLDEANLAFEYALRICTALAFALSGLGLFGLSTYEIERRTKEIGIRKALGATSLQIAWRFLARFAALAGIANLIAWPVGFALLRGIFAMIQYPHPLVIGPESFVEAALASFAVAILTVGAQTLRAASANPVNALRYE